MLTRGVPGLRVCRARCGQGSAGRRAEGVGSGAPGPDLGTQGRLPEEAPSETKGAGQGEDEVKEEEKAILGRRNDQTTWHLPRPTVTGFGWSLEYKCEHLCASVCVHRVCVCMYVCVCVCLGQGRGWGVRRVET